MAKLRVDKIAAPIVQDEFTGSVYFDGNGDYLSMPDSTDFTMGTGDYTIEGWFYFNATGTNRLFGQRNSSAGESQLLGEFYDGHTISYYHSIGGTNYTVTKTNIISLQTWYHIAITRHKQVLHLYVNGVLQSTNTTTGSLDDRAQPFVIGRQGNFTSNTFNGYISNFRICKGHAVYTGNFTPPTRELEVHTKPPKGVVFPAADNVTVLLACQSATDATLDSSGRHTITANGDAHAQSANPGLLRRTLNLTTVTENTGAVFFDGTDDRLDIAHSIDFRIDDSNTFECWIYYNSLPGNNLFLGVESSYWVGYNHTGVGGASNKFVFTIYNGSSWQAVSSSTTPVVGTWYHIAAVKDGTSLKMFVNGVLENTTTMSGTAAAVTDFFNIGKWNQASAGQGVNGYLSNVRVCKGHAVYTSTFTPPTRELEVHPGPDDDRTVLLCCYDGENIFADKTGRHVLMAYGDRQSTPTQSLNNSPVGVTTNNPGLTRNVDPTAGPTFQGGAGYTSQNWLTLPKGTTAERFVEVANNAVSASSARGLFLGGSSPTMRNTIDYITIPTAGNAKDFGDLTAAHQYVTSVSSNTRGVNGGGDPTTNIIDYVTISTLGNAKDFGDLFTGRYGTGGCSSGIRGVWAGGFPGSGNVNTIDFVTIASTGNANDFGDLTAGKGYLAGCGSPSRGLFAGGLTPTKINTIEFITIASMGNAFDFGDLTSVRAALSGCSSSTRGVFVGGNTPTMVNIIDYVAIPTTGNAVDFGDQSVTRENVGACSSKTRGVFGGGNDPSNTKLNTIDFVEFATLGDATDFGDLTQNRKGIAGCSNGHGGLG